MAKRYGILGLTFGQVFASITSSSKKKGAEEVKAIARMEHLAEIDIIIYDKEEISKKDEVTLHYVVPETRTVSDKRVSRRNLVQEFVSLSKPSGETLIVAIEG